ncbi:MAG: hypothetical protein WEA04_04400 [Candidatus Andersenbacteria bacterium]
MLKLFHVFLLVLAIGLVVQSTLWKNIDVLDAEEWMSATVFLYQGDARVFNKFTYGYPGTPLLLLAGAIHVVLAIPLTTSFTGSLATLISLSAAGIAATCKLLRPRSLWWIAATGIILCNRLYAAVTPPSAAVAPLIVLIFLLSLYIYEQRSQSLRVHIMLGISLGVGAALRLDITAAVGFLLLIFLLPSLGGKRIGVIVSTAFLSFFLLNPFLWFTPLGHLQAIIAKIHYHWADYETERLTIPLFLNRAAVGLLGFSLAVVLLFLRQRLPLLISRKFLLYTVFVTISISIILWQASYQVPWYFYPLIFFWEALLSLFLLDLAALVHYPFLTSLRAQQLLRQSVQISVIILLVGAQVLLLLTEHFLPEGIYLLSLP